MINTMYRHKLGMCMENAKALHGATGFANLVRRLKRPRARHFPITL